MLNGFYGLYASELRVDELQPFPQCYGICFVSQVEEFRKKFGKNRKGLLFLDIIPSHPCKS